MRATIFMLLAALPALAPAAAGRAPGAAPDPSAAATTSSRAAPSASARQLARALLPEDQWNQLLDDYASSLSGQVSGALLGKGEPVPDDLRANIRKELGERLAYRTTLEAHANALAHQFTPEEIERTAQFYDSPVGRKVLARLPDAQAELGQELQARLATAVPEIVQRLAPKALGEEGAQGSGSGAPAPEGGRR